MNFFNLLNTRDLKFIQIKFFVSIKTSTLTKRYHYNFKQKHLYDIVKDLYENKIKHIYIDGEDDTFIDTKYSNKSLYFKRELNEKVGNILPISFAIPKSK